ncbi:type I restriction enzyme HsdR N-terminal domain-containing protein (plasmid) [Paracoccus marcusii]|uniref:type I restriction enzyme HsdR N-terminal domain-containing protein n=1 Tax=Paracoccus marcusii TaxID=59779 RepID=UPI0038BCE149
MDIVDPKIKNSVDGYNEAEVRFHIIDPIIRQLGYTNNDNVFLHLEEKLEYPYVFIGHKNKRKDLPLGFPDYRAGIKGRRGSFIVEAKSSTVGISKKDIEQAHSYAAHAQVGANYFLLSDGRSLSIYETLSGSNSEPICRLHFEEINRKFYEIENILSPSNLEKNCRVNYDKGLKLCAELGSSVEIRSGEYFVENWFYKIFIDDKDCTESVKISMPQILQLDRQLEALQRDYTLRVEDGKIYRGPSGRIFSNISFSGVTKNNHAGMKMLGIQEIELTTDSEFISLHVDSPTTFESTTNFSLKKGDMMPPMFGNAVALDKNVSGDMLVTTKMHKDNNSIVGDYSVISEYRFEFPMMGKVRFELNLVGTFILRLLA